MNKHSLHSHFVFTLRIHGTHVSGNGERVGTLNLVDLAGSERLATLSSVVGSKHQKETQSINKSLGTLRDVVMALGKGPNAHVPFRDSTLTYLRKQSLSRESQILMLLSLSRLAAHLNESLNLL
ncbi:kinesin motor domain-containing protein [Mycena vulgaris]|nr:kinesin motor domain-containing protein [Mycena vulgaris]